MDENQKDETGWLIETANTTYWDGHGLEPMNFTENHANAVRFARRIDAEIVISWLLGKYQFALRAVDHSWMKP